MTGGFRAYMKAEERVASGVGAGKEGPVEAAEAGTVNDSATFVGIVTGLQREIKVIEGSLGAGMRAISSGANAARAEAAAHRLVAEGATVLLSVGYAGGLSPDVASGTVVLANEVIADGGQRYGVPASWLDAAERRLAGAADLRVGPIAGCDGAVTGRDGKRELWLGTGALAADMESHAVARVALGYRLPFAAVRVVVDDARTSLPLWLADTVTPDGASDPGRLMGEVMRHPTALPTLISLAWAERKSARALGRVVARLRGGFLHEAHVP